MRFIQNHCLIFIRRPSVTDKKGLSYEANALQKDLTKAREMRARLGVGRKG